PPGLGAFSAAAWRGRRGPCSSFPPGHGGGTSSPRSAPGSSRRGGSRAARCGGSGGRSSSLPPASWSSPRRAGPEGPCCARSGTGSAGPGGRRSATRCAPCAGRSGTRAGTSASRSAARSADGEPRRPPGGDRRGPGQTSLRAVSLRAVSLRVGAPLGGRIPPGSRVPLGCGVLLGLRAAPVAPAPRPEQFLLLGGGAAGVAGRLGASAAQRAPRDLVALTADAEKAVPAALGHVVLPFGWVLVAVFT